MILCIAVSERQVPTKRFESFREGLEDVAYMSLLEKAGTKEAKSLLDARDDVMKAHDHKTLDAWRLAAGRAIDAAASSR